MVMRYVAWIAMLVAPVAMAQHALNLGDMRLAVMDDPVRIAFDPGAAPPQDRLRQTIAIVTGSRGWMITGEQDGRWSLAREIRGKHALRAQLSCEAGGCLIRYAGSDDLLYEERTISGENLRIIHRNYNNWVRDLAQSIVGALGMSRNAITYGFAHINAVEAVPFLNEEGRQAYRDFLQGIKPRAFAIAPNGAWGVGTPTTPTPAFDPLGIAVDRCNQRGAGQCRLYAVDDRVIWPAP